MKVDFKNCTFGEYPNKELYDYSGKDYEYIELDIVLDDGTKETHRIGTAELQHTLFNDFDEGYDNSDDDNFFSYYANDDESLYLILEQITGEKVN